MKIVTANLVPSRYEDERDQWDSRSQYSGGEGPWIEYSVRSRSSRVKHTVMYVGPDGACRREHGGAVLPGPYGALIAQGTMIASHPVSQPHEVVELEDGDVILCNGVPLVVAHNFYREPHLISLEAYEGRDAAAAAEIRAQL